MLILFLPKLLQLSTLSIHTFADPLLVLIYVIDL